MTGSIYWRGCPYCDYRGTDEATFYHLRLKHPEKPKASDMDFPGWRK